MSYPGGKEGDGVYQAIINQLPPHRVYVEPFAGHVAVMRHKLPAEHNLAIDLDPSAVRWCRREVPSTTAVSSGGGPFRPRWDFVVADGIRKLQERRWSIDTLHYIDPPYLLATRSSGPMYRFEMTEAQHMELLRIVKRLDCMVVVSGYWSELYARELKGWRTVTYTGVQRSGEPSLEWLWLNFPEPAELHDYRYLGRTFRDREQIHRKLRRWRCRLEAMPMLERQALLSMMLQLRSPGAHSKSGDAAGHIARNGDACGHRRT